MCLCLNQGFTIFLLRQVLRFILTENKSTASPVSAKQYRIEYKWNYVTPTFEWRINANKPWKSAFRTFCTWVRTKNRVDDKIHQDNNCIWRYADQKCMSLTVSCFAFFIRLLTRYMQSSLPSKYRTVSLLLNCSTFVLLARFMLLLLSNHSSNYWLGSSLLNLFVKVC